VDNCYDSRGSGGYTGGYLGWEPSPAPLLWKSTEHNLDCYAAFSRLYQLTGDVQWTSRADYARGFVESMWVPPVAEPTIAGHFLTGTRDDGITPNTDAVPLDAQAWAVLALGADQYEEDLQWVMDNCRVAWLPFEGFDFNEDRDGIWWEGTAQMTASLQAASRLEDSLTEIRRLQFAQESAPNGNGLGLVAATPGPITTGFDWVYYPRLHVGATSWYLLCLAQYNPFTGQSFGFSDISQDFWAWKYILACRNAGIVGGYWDGYHPDEAVNRAQMPVYIARALAGGDANVPTGPATPTFTDVPTDFWAYRYIEYAHAQNVVGGYWDGTYRPDLIVNRDAMAVFVARGMVAPVGDVAIPPGPETPTFPDVSADHWAYRQIEYCHDHGVVGGYRDGYHPDESVTRAQMTVYVQRAFGLPM